MKKEVLIKKWLDGELTAEENKEFQQLEEYASYIKLSDKSQFFKMTDYDSKKAYEKLRPIIFQKRVIKSLFTRLNPMIQVAAVLVIGFVIYTQFFLSTLTTVDTVANQKLEVVLPDASLVQLNSLSQLSFNKKKWSEIRKVNLTGEAYFKVAKGSRFDVETSSGTVSVLGTQFNVKNREDYFEVKCFEGKVRVSYNDQKTELDAGKALRIVHGKIIHSEIAYETPFWIDNFSNFESVPFSEVINEFERQYDVKIKTDIDINQLFTGRFMHTDITMALQSITLPLNIKYYIINDIITLKKGD
jgi:transmembrane sensor